MRFAHPWWLLSLAPALAAVLVAWRRVESRRAAWAFPDGAALAERVPAAGAWAVRRLPLALKAAALVLAALALARPQASSRQSAGLTEGIDIMLLTDTSLSMKALDFAPLDRMAAAKETAKRFVQGRVADRIGLIVFGGAPVLSCPLTLDYDALMQSLDAMEPGMTGVDGTAIGDGIAAAVNHLRSGKAASKVVILLTDGRSNAGEIDPITAAKAAASYGIKIYTIGTGKRGQSLIPVDDPVQGKTLVTIDDDLDDDLLTRVAEAAGGKYFRATSLSELSHIYSEIDLMEKTAFERPPSIAYRDLYPWFVLPALGLVLLEMTLSRTWLLRLP